MRIYVAGPSSHLELCRGVINRVIESGARISHDWTKSFGAVNGPDKIQLAVQDYNGVAHADVLLLVHTATDASMGKWVELGIAIAHGIEVWAVYTCRTAMKQLHEKALFLLHPRARNLMVFPLSDLEERIKCKLEGGTYEVDWISAPAGSAGDGEEVDRAENQEPPAAEQESGHDAGTEQGVPDSTPCPA